MPRQAPLAHTLLADFALPDLPHQPVIAQMLGARGMRGQFQLSCIVELVHKDVLETGSRQNIANVDEGLPIPCPKSVACR